MATGAGFPLPMDDDHEDVHWALSTAGSLHSQGEFAEALRWLHKAVAVAVACDLDVRALELGRIAADLEERLGAVSTERGGSGAPLVRPRKQPLASSFTVDEHTVRSAIARHPGSRETLEDVLIDGLDDPTHIDSSRSPSTLMDGTPPQDVVVDSEPTMVPFTKMSPGVDNGTTGPQLPHVAQGSGTQPIDEASVPKPHGFSSMRDSATMPAYQPAIHDEATLAMSAAPNVDELGVSAEVPSVEQTMPAMTSLSRFRVALLASPDGHDPRVMLLRKGEEAPAGVGVATLVPVSSKDAEVVATLLGVQPKKRRR
jgi:hypothetical protein